MASARMRAIGGGFVGAGVGSLLMLLVLAATGVIQLSGADSLHARRLSDREQLKLVVELASRQHSVPADLLWAMMEVESRFDPNAKSRKGAQGLMQLMPATARELQVSDPFDPLQSIDGGARYLRILLTRFRGREDLAVAAYNAGPGAVERHRGVPPYPETRAYVRKVLKGRRAV